MGSEAAVAVSRIDPGGKRTAAHIAALLKAADGRTRRQAVVAASMIGATARWAAGAIAEATRDAEQSVRYEAVKAMAAISPDLSQALDALSRALRDPDRHVRGAAAASLRALDPTAAGTVGVWLGVLGGSDDASLRCCAAGALGGATVRPEDVEAALLRATEDADRHVRSQAAHSLKRVRQR